MLDFNEFLQQRRAALRPVKEGPSSSSAGQDDQQQQQAWSMKPLLQQERSATAPGAALLPSSSSRLGPSRQLSLLRDGGPLAGSLSSRGQLLPNSSSSLLLHADSLGSPRSPRTASAAAAVAAATAATIAALKSCTSFDRALSNAAAAGTGSGGGSGGGNQQQLQLQLQQQKHSSGTSPVQPLSLADALLGCSPRSGGGGTAAGSGAATPTYSGRRYPGGDASSRLLSAEPSGASAAAVGHQQGAPSGAIADAMAAIMQQQQLLRQMSSRRQQQQQQAGSGPDADGGTAAGQLLGQLDNRFGALKQSFQDVFGLQQQQQQQGEQEEDKEVANLHSQPATPLAALPPAAGAASRQHGGNAPRSSFAHGLFQGEAADPFSLGNSSSSSLGSSNDGSGGNGAQGERQPGSSSSGARQLLQRCSEGGQEQVVTLNGGVAAGAGHSTHHGAGHDVFAVLVGDYGSLLDVGASTLPPCTDTAAAEGAGGGPSASALPGEPLASGSSSDVGLPQQQRPGRQRQPRPPPPREQQQAQGAQPGAAAAPWRPVGPVSSSAQSFSAGSDAAPPQPRALRPQPSVQQQTFTHRHRQQKGGGTRAGTAGAALGIDNSSTSTATASDAAGVVLEDAEEQRWASAALRAAKQQAAELQAQNDALVRVLERERRQHAKARQQVADGQLALKEARAEWEVTLQALRQDEVAMRARLRKALAAGEQAEAADAYEAALAASAARVEEAQAAAASLAAQLAEVELQLQQLQHVCGSSPAALAVACAGGSGTLDAVAADSREDGAAVLLAVAGEAARSPQKQRAAAGAAAAAADGVCGASRGVRALRQHQRQLEQQVARQTAALAALERDNLKLLRYRKQFESAAQALDGVAAAKAAAEAYATEAGLRAAAASGRADRLELQVDELLQRSSLLHADRDRLAMQLQEAQQLLRLQAQVVGQRASSPAPLDAAASVAGQAGAPLCANPPPQAEEADGTAGAPDPPDANAGAGCSGTERQQPVSALPAEADSCTWGNAPLQQQKQATAGCSSTAATAGTAAPVLAQQQQQRPPGVPGQAAEAPTAASASAGSADRDALAAMEQLSASLPAGSASQVHEQLAALMAALQSGMRERQQLAAQGQLLLDLVVMPAARGGGAGGGAGGGGRAL